MKLRQKSKRDQTVDAVASVAKTWSEWHLGERVAKTAAKGAKKASKGARRASSLKDSKVASVKRSRNPFKGAVKSTPVKVAGAVALVGGLGAAVAKKLRGGHAEPPYTPPGPVADMPAPPPSPVAVGDLDDGAVAQAQADAGAAPSADDAPIAVEPGTVEVGDLGDEDTQAEAEEAPEAEEAQEAEADETPEAEADGESGDGEAAEAADAESEEKS